VAFSDYLVAFLLVCNMLPEEWEIGQDFLRRLLQLCQQEPFFGFFILTENDHSLALFQELLRQNKADIAPDFLSDFARLWTSVDGRLAKIVAGSKTTGEVNQKIDQWLLK
jgi:hypothetical protein